jgi:hypothetical protein
MNWVGMGEVIVQTVLKIRQIHFAKIRKTLKSVRAIFDVSSRYRSIAGEYMRNRENDKFDSGRTHPGIYKNKEWVLPLSTR